MELNKAVIDCMQSLRRRLRAELAVDIRLSQPDAGSAGSYKVYRGQRVYS
ncbi:hypothetical protein [Pseudomonas marincola]|nr:hypothetical protein [Pseudomonas marincola]SFU01187.1 hypothetical protein SAMN05216264_108126 [Pseudomonas marincola]